LWALCVWFFTLQKELGGQGAGKFVMFDISCKKYLVQKWEALFALMAQ
jgi:hypothetical protein